MANLNNGKPVDFKDITDYQQAAHDFAEGSEELEKLLLNCFTKGIETHACCRGHEKDESRAYVSLSYIPKNKELISLMLLTLQDYAVRFGFVKLAKHQSFITLYHDVDHNFSDSTSFFQQINEVVTAYQQGIKYSSSLPLDLQKYVQIMDFAENDVLLNNRGGNNYFELFYAKRNNNHQYNIISSDHYYEVAAAQSGFKLLPQTEFYNEYQISSPIREETIEPLKKLSSQIESFQPKESLPKLISTIDEHLALDSGEEIDFEFIDSPEVKVPRLKVNLGDSVYLVSQKLKLCHDRGYQVNAIFNGVELSSLNSDNIVESYQEAISHSHK